MEIDDKLISQIKINHERLVKHSEENDGSYEGDETYFNAQSLEWVLKLIEGKTTEDFIQGG